MAFAKEMTIATGHTVRLGEDEHEIKVSLTYELERDDHDVLLLAAVKAGEVQNAHKAACQQMHSLWTARDDFADDDAPPHDETDEDDLNEAFGHEDEPPASAVSVTFQPPPPAPMSNGRAAGNGFGKPNAPAPQNGGQKAEEKDKERTEEKDKERGPAKWLSPGNEPATTPQKIAIRSLVKQAGLDDARLRDLLWDNFETVRLEKLSKYQAALLMLALKNGTWQNGIPGATTKATIH